MEDKFIETYRNKSKEIPIDISPLMSEEQYNTAMDIQKQGYNYTAVAKEYNKALTQQKDKKQEFYNSRSYEEIVGIREFTNKYTNNDEGFNLVLDSYNKDKDKATKVFTELGIAAIQRNDLQAKQSKDGFTGAIVQGNKNASQLRTLLGLYNHRIGLNTPEKRMQAIQLLNAELGTSINLDENGKFFTLGIDGQTKIDLEPGIMSAIQNNSVTILSSAIFAGRLGAGIGQTLGLRTLTDFYRLGLGAQVKAGAKVGVVSGVLGGLPDLIAGADGQATKNIYLAEEYQNVAQKILDNPYEERLKNFGLNVAGDVIGGAVGPVAIKGIATGINKTSDLSLAIAKAPQHIKDKFRSVKDTTKNVINESSKNDEYGLLNQAKRKVKRMTQSMSTTATDMNATIADDIITKNQTEATKTLSKLEQTDAFLKESGWSTEELSKLTPLEKLILTNLSTKTTAQPILDQMTQILGLDDLAIVKQHGKLIAQNQLDSIIELSNAVQNNTLSPSSLLNNINEFIPNIRLANNALAKQYESQLVTLNPEVLGNFKPAIIKLVEFNSGLKGGIKNYSLFDAPMSEQTLLDIKQKRSAVNFDSYFEQNKFMRATTYFGHSNIGKQLTEMDKLSNLENVGLDDYMKLLVDFEVNADKLRSKVPDIDNIIEKMKIDIAKYSEANPLLLEHLEVMKQSALEAKKLMHFYNNNTNIGKNFIKFKNNADLNLLPSVTKSVLTMYKSGEVPDLHTLASAFKIPAKDLEYNFIQNLVNTNIIRDANGKITFDSIGNIMKNISETKDLFVTKEGKYLANQIYKLAQYNSNFINNLNSLTAKDGKFGSTSFLATSMAGRAQMFLVSRQWKLLTDLTGRVLKTDAAVMRYTANKTSKLFTSDSAIPKNITSNFNENIAKIVAEPEKAQHINLTISTLQKMVNEGKMSPEKAITLMKQYGALIDDIKTARQAMLNMNQFDEQTMKLLQDDEVLNKFLLTGTLE